MFTLEDLGLSELSDLYPLGPVEGCGLKSHLSLDAASGDELDVTRKSVPTPARGRAASSAKSQHDLAPAVEVSTKRKAARSSVEKPAAKQQQLSSSSSASSQKSLTIIMRRDSDLLLVANHDR